MTWLMLLVFLDGCAVRSLTGNICGGTATLTSYAILAKPKWSIMCPDGKVVRFESDDSVAEALRELKKGN